MSNAPDGVRRATPIWSVVPTCRRAGDHDVAVLLERHRRRRRAVGAPEADQRRRRSRHRSVVSRLPPGLSRTTPICVAPIDLARSARPSPPCHRAGRPAAAMKSMLGGGAGAERGDAVIGEGRCRSAPGWPAEARATAARAPAARAISPGNQAGLPTRSPSTVHDRYPSRPREGS